MALNQDAIRRIDDEPNYGSRYESPTVAGNEVSPSGQPAGATNLVLPALVKPSPAETAAAATVAAKAVAQTASDRRFRVSPRARVAVNKKPTSGIKI